MYAMFKINLPYGKIAIFYNITYGVNVMRFETISAQVFRVFRLLLAGSASLCVIQTASADTISSHSEVHVSNLQISASGGGLLWLYNPGLVVTAAGAFDDPSGWSQAYDDDLGATGASASSAATHHAAAQASASWNLGTINASADIINNTGNAFALNSYSYGDLYNVFQNVGSDPLNATFSLDWSAKIWGQATGLQRYSADFAVEILLRDGINEWREGVTNTLTGSAYQLYSDGGSLGLSLILQPDTLYSLDIIAHPDLPQITVTTVPSPGTIFLFGPFALALLGIKGLARKPKTPPAGSFGYD